MHYALAAAFVLGILTLWVPAYWPVTVFEVSVFAVAAAVVIRSRNNLPAFSYPLIPLAFAPAWGLTQLFTGSTISPFDTKTAIVQWTAFLAVFVAAWILFQDPFAARWFRLAMLWFGFVVSIWAVLQTFTSGGKVLWVFPTDAGGYLMGPILSRNHWAAFVEVLLPMALYEALRREGDSLLYAGMAGALYASVIASASRAGTVLTSAELVVVIVVMWQTGRTSGRSAGLALLQIVALAAAFTAIVGWQTVLDRFLEADPFRGRREFDISSLHMISARPWLGFGLGTWPTAYPRFAIIDLGVFANRAHDDWLEWTADGGLPLGLMLSTLFLWTLRPAFRSVWGLGVVSVFLHAIVDYPFSRPALGSWPILVIAMLAAHKNEREP